MKELGPLGNQGEMPYSQAYVSLKREFPEACRSCGPIVQRMWGSLALQVRDGEIGFEAAKNKITQDSRLVNCPGPTIPEGGFIDTPEECMYGTA